MTPRLWDKRARIGALALAIGALAAAPASAADSVYWANFSGNAIAVTSLDGSVAGHDLYSGSPDVNQPAGVALDPAANKIYWANANGSLVKAANLDGSGGIATLATAGAPISAPRGLAIDPGAGRLYWANAGTDSLAFANLDGSGGGAISTAGTATFDTPYGPAIDPSANKIYWGNYSDGVNIGVGVAVGYTNLDDTGGSANLITTPGGPVSGPSGIAIDQAAGRLVWSNNALTSFGQADLAPGGNGASLPTTGASISNPAGVALDPAAGRFYWTNQGGGMNTAIGFANLDGSAMGGSLMTGSATTNLPFFIAILKKPEGVGAPTASGGSLTGSTLTCSNGTWADNLVGAHLFRAPRSFAHQWTLNGTDLAGATANTVTANAPGDYACRVTAANAAGDSAPQTSASHPVSAPPATTSPPATDPTTKKKCKKGRKLRKGKCVKKKGKKK